MARALVVGANGFLGSHLVDSLVAAGHEVRAFDRFSSPEPTFQATGVEIFRGEFLSRTDLDRAVAGQEMVFHFLSTTTPASAEADPTLDVRTNVAQSIELLESSVHAGVEHFYYASTGGAIYGLQGFDSYKESDRALPISPYGIGKLTIERYLGYFRELYGLNATTFRISNPYGPRQHPNKPQGLIPIALRQAGRGDQITVLGDGSMVRDYIYVADAINMVAQVVAGAATQDIYNIGGGRGTSVNEIIDIVGNVVDRPLSIQHRATPATFVDRVVLDISRFTAEFGQPSLTPLDEGILTTARAMGIVP